MDKYVFSVTNVGTHEDACMQSSCRRLCTVCLICYGLLEMRDVPEHCQHLRFICHMRDDHRMRV